MPSKILQGVVDQRGNYLIPWEPSFTSLPGERLIEYLNLDSESELAAGLFSRSFPVFSETLVVDSGLDRLGPVVQNDVGESEPGLGDESIYTVLQGPLCELHPSGERFIAQISWIAEKISGLENLDWGSNILFLDEQYYQVQDSSEHDQGIDLYLQPVLPYFSYPVYQHLNTQLASLISYLLDSALDENLIFSHALLLLRHEYSLSMDQNSQYWDDSVLASA